MHLLSRRPISSPLSPDENLLQHKMGRMFLNNDKSVDGLVTLRKSALHARPRHDHTGALRCSHVRSFPHRHTSPALT